MTVTSFTAKQLRVTLTLASPNTVFPGTNSNTLVLTGLRVLAVVNAVARQATNADIHIYGMLPTDMNALTVTWLTPQLVLNNIVILEANDGSGWVQVFSGTMIEGQPDYRGAPDAFFRIQAATGYFGQALSVLPKSYTGATSVPTIVKDLAAQLGFAFKNSGVTASLASPYLPGTAFDQLRQVCQAANVDFYFIGNTIVICPANQPRSDAPVVVLNAQSGLIGYPIVERAGLNVQCLFNPAIDGGGKIKIESKILPSTGLWVPIALVHTLESVNPSGAWFSSLTCIRAQT